MHPFGGLPANLASFCAALRRDHGFRIGSGELLDAARALHLVDLADPRAVRHALRAVLAGTRDDAAVFDEAFDRFFFQIVFPEPEARSHDQPPAVRPEPEGGPGGEEPATRRRPTAASTVDADDLAGAGTGPMVPLETSEGEEAAHVARASYSPIAVESSETPEVGDVDQAWVEAARALLRRVQLGLSRRWRPAVKGRRFDLRRTLRASLQTGGEPLAPRWLGRPRRAPRFVVLIDGSRSMGEHANTALKVAAALARATSRVEVFTFSTALRRVTSEVRSAVGGQARRLPHLAHAWGGGTSIGACLGEFLRRFGERVIGRDTVVIVASDGLDVGEPASLLASMRVLSRRAAGVVWLNPLVATPGYEPTAVGMSTARPFVTTFTSVNNLTEFVQLSRLVRVRA
jgi:uncharacterized protein with von Willebrand factor type A (vWA) domain